MKLQTEDERSRRGVNPVTIGFAVLAVAASAVALWTRQSEDALLGADSIGGAVATVLFWALPGLVLYVALARSPLAVVVEGTLIVALTVAQWWASARDGHSTASLGPGILGWLLIPGIVVAGRVLPALWQGWRTGSRDTRRFLAIVVVASALGTLVLGPFAWLLGGVVGARRLRPSGPGDGRHRDDT